MGDQPLLCPQQPVTGVKVRLGPQEPFGGGSLQQVSLAGLKQNPVQHFNPFHFRFKDAQVRQEKVTVGGFLIIFRSSGEYGKNFQNSTFLPAAKRQVM